MKKSKRFQALARIAANKELASAKELGVANNNLNTQKDKLNDLIHYRNEYVTSFKLQGEKGMDGAQLHTYQQFLQNINNALTQQHKLIALAEIECQQQKSSWREQHSKTKIIDNVIDNYKKNEQHLKDKQEQKDNDERNSRSHQTKSDK